jgi:2-polyprenyl-3-methyl-5-hydroxy-6-metoxy-1,4-benzoquinol methylase
VLRRKLRGSLEIELKLKGKKVMATPAGHSQPNPEIIFETLNAHQRTAALRASIELDIFTAIGEGASTAEAVSKRCEASARGIRTLCDYLTIIGLLTKKDHAYALTPDSAAFLDRRSPAYIGSVSAFLTTPDLVDRYKDLTAIVRNGGAIANDTTEPDNPIWVEFARSMAPMMRPSAEAIAGIVGADAGEKWKVLDIAAGHGVFGIAIAKHNPNAEIFAADWSRVLDVAKENAKAAKVDGRYHTIVGSAFDVEFGSGYDLVLLTNFLHHFDPSTNEKLLRKIHAALGPKGRVATLEFVPNDDRISPSMPAQFSLTMLASTRAGDSYTFSELEKMFKNAGFTSSKLAPPLPGPESVIVSQK